VKKGGIGNLLMQFLVLASQGFAYGVRLALYAYSVRSHQISTPHTLGELPYFVLKNCAAKLGENTTKSQERQNIL
jgi:hypothetical protein